MSLRNGTKHCCCPILMSFGWCMDRPSQQGHSTENRLCMLWWILSKTKLSWSLLIWEVKPPFIWTHLFFYAQLYAFHVLLSSSPICQALLWNPESPYTIMKSNKSTYSKRSGSSICFHFGSLIKIWFRSCHFVQVVIYGGYSESSLLRECFWSIDLTVWILNSPA